MLRLNRLSGLTAAVKKWCFEVSNLTYKICLFVLFWFRPEKLVLSAVSGGSEVCKDIQPCRERYWQLNL